MVDVVDLPVVVLAHVPAGGQRDGAGGGRPMADRGRALADRGRAQVDGPGLGKPLRDLGKPEWGILRRPVVALGPVGDHAPPCGSLHASLDHFPRHFRYWTLHSATLTHAPDPSYPLLLALVAKTQDNLTLNFGHYSHSVRMNLSPCGGLACLTDVPLSLSPSLSCGAQMLITMQGMGPILEALIKDSSFML